MDEIAVGLIRKAHGLGGEVLIELWTDDPDEVFRPGRTFGVTGTRGPHRLTLESVRPHKRGRLLRFREIGDRNGAEALRGRDLTLRVDELRELGEDEFFVHELVGYAVVLASGVPVGDVTTSYETGGQLLLEVRAGDREVLIPFGRQLVTRVDRDERRIVIDPPQGLLEG